MSRILELQKIIACDIIQGNELLKYIRQQDQLLKKLPIHRRREEIAKILAYKPIQYTRKEIEAILAVPQKVDKYPMIKERLLAGHSNESIARDLHVSKETVRKVRVMYGLSKPELKRFSDEDLLSAVAKGYTPIQIARMFDVTSGAIHKRMKKLNVVR
jgi:DNA-binding CsgD family transcriptional regulator